MKKFKFTAALATLTLASAGSAYADNNYGAGLKAGTLGLGLEASWQPLPYLDLRLGANTYDYRDQDTRSGVNYDQELKLRSYYGTANLHFPVSPLRITAGVYANGNEIHLKNDEEQDQSVGGVVYPGSGIGTMKSETTFDSVAPYLGIGFDFTIGNKVGLNLDLGVLWQGEPNVTLEASGSLSDDPEFQSALEAERRELEEDMSDFKAWPLVQLGLVYRF